MTAPVACDVRAGLLQSLLAAAADEHDMPVTMRHIGLLAEALAVQMPLLLAPGSAACPLTGKQLATLRLVANGLADEDIAVRLGLSPAAVHDRVRRTLARLGAQSRTHVVALCMAAGWITAVDIGPVKPKDAE